MTDNCQFLERVGCSRSVGGKAEIHGTGEEEVHETIPPGWKSSSQERRTECPMTVGRFNIEGVHTD